MDSTHQKILIYRHFIERAWDLIGHAYAKVAPFGRRLMGNIPALKDYRTVLRSEGAGEQIKYRGFSCTVWSHNAKDFTLLYIKRESVHSP